MCDQLTHSRRNRHANADDSVPAETTRPQPKVASDRPFGTLAQPKLETGARRPAVDRHGSRNGSMFSPTIVSVFGCMLTSIISF